MWLRDRLPDDFPTIRVLTYGYDTKLRDSESFQDIKDIALTFISQLKCIKANPSTKPLIIFAHSLGGLVLKQAMVFLARGGEADTFILDKIQFVMCFGVPSKGMKVDYMLNMVESQPNAALVKLLSEEITDGYLAQLTEEFSGVSLIRQIRQVSAYETRMTREAVEVRPGVWERKGPLTRLVARESAIQPDSKPADAFAIDRNHSTMVKFAEDDHSYPSVKGFLSSTFQSSEVLPSTGIELRGSTSRNPVPGDDTVDSQEQMDKGSLQSLYFDDKNFRVDAIDEKHTGSFKWLLDPASGFIPWLQNDSPFFWFQGKAGSGKSTLMKHVRNLLSDPDMIGDLDLPHEEQLVWYFFNQRGSYLQKSIEGLMRSILYGLAKKLPTVAGVVRDFYIKKNKKYQNVWTEEELFEVFKLVQSHQDTKLDLILFLDALDEYNGYPETIADLLYTLSGNRDGSSPFRIKICFSSRPWDVFLQRFSSFDCLVLQNFTKDDIRLYTTDRLRSLKVFDQTSWIGRTQELRSIMSENVDAIVAGAEGVFLWVKLVIDDLEEMDLEDPADIQNQLGEMPRNLEDYYYRTVQRLDPNARMDTFVLLELVLRSREPVCLQDLIEASLVASMENVQDCIERLTKRHKLYPSAQYMAQSLKNLCGGLLEIVGELNNKSVVQFIHQTARDLVSQPVFREKLLGKASSAAIGNGHLFWFKWEVSQFIRDERKHLFNGLNFKVPALLWYAHLAEATTGTHCGPFIDSIPHDVSRFLVNGMDYPPYSYIDAQTYIAVFGDLRIYFLARITRARQDSNPTTWENLKSETVKTIQLILVNVFFRLDEMPPSYSLGAMIRLHMEHEDNTVQAISHLNLWYALFTPYIYDYVNRAHHLFEDSSLEVAKVLLEAGEDPNMKLTSESMLKISPQPLHLRGLDRRLHCRPLHLSDLAITRLLLDFGADVNMTDWRGETPLDVCVITYVDRLKSSDGLPEIFPSLFTADLLVRRGGCLSQAGKRHFERVREEVQKDDVLRGGRFKPEEQKDLLQLIQVVTSAGVLPDQSTPEFEQESRPAGVASASLLPDQSTSELEQESRPAGVASASLLPDQSTSKLEQESRPAGVASASLLPDQSTSELEQESRPAGVKLHTGRGLRDRIAAKIKFRKKADGSKHE